MALNIVANYAANVATRYLTKADAAASNSLAISSSHVAGVYICLIQLMKFIFSLLYLLALAVTH